MTFPFAQNHKSSTSAVRGLFWLSMGYIQSLNLEKDRDYYAKVVSMCDKRCLSSPGAKDGIDP